MSGLETRACLCGICGWQLFWDGSDKNIAIFPVTFDEDISIMLAGNMFCADKGNYYQIDDGLPQVEAENPALTIEFYTRALVQ